MKNRGKQYLADNRSKKIREEISKYYKKIDKTKDKLTKLEIQKSIIKDYYSKNSRNIDDDVLISLYNNLSVNRKTMSEFFTGLITTLAFTLLWELIFNEEDGISRLFTAIISLFLGANWFGRIVIGVIGVAILAFWVVMVICFVKTVFNQVTALTLSFNSYENMALNKYHKKTISDILKQRKKIIKNQVEYENRDVLNLDYRIEVYTLERIE